MEDADSDSGFDSDGDWYHAGRDIVHGVSKLTHPLPVLVRLIGTQKGQG